MVDGLVRDRRRVAQSDEQILRDCLNEAQQGALRALEYFGWKLRFVRNRSDPTPVMFSGDDSFIVIRPDGSIDAQAELMFRQ